MAKFCSECGDPLAEDWRVCPRCETPIANPRSPALAARELDEPSAPVEVSPPPQQDDATLFQRLEYHWNQTSGPTECPGCQRATGPPGALCPFCGSRFPSPKVGLVGLGLAALGGFLLLIAYLATGGLLETDRRNGSSPVEAVGWLTLLIGGAIFVYSVGRSGPQRQASCCGCSCVVAALALPSTALLLYAAGGPSAAALALPVWIPLVWVLDAAWVAGWLGRRAAVELARAAAQASASSRG